MPDGSIVTGARRDRFARDFLEVLESAIARLRPLGFDHAIYVYGSVANGTAEVGHSDVDLLTIGLPAAVASEAARRLTADYTSLCRSVEIAPAHLMDYDGDSGEAYGNRVFLRHYCVRLVGPDLASSWPPFRADAAAARGLNGDIGQFAERWRTEVSTTTDATELARRIARKTLLAVAGLVSVRDTIWTTDRWAAARRWADVKPQSATAMHVLTAWARGEAGAVERIDVQAMLDGEITAIVDAFSSQIGLWDEPARAFR